MRSVLRVNTVLHFIPLSTNFTLAFSDHFSDNMSHLFSRSFYSMSRIIKQQRFSNLLYKISKVNTLKIFQAIRHQHSQNTSWRGLHETSNMPFTTDDAVTSHARQIFDDAVQSVMPRQMLERRLKYVRGTNTLYIDGKEYKLNNNLYVVGFGKAVSGMARVVDDMLCDHIVRGIISIPFETTEQMKNANKHYMLLDVNSRIKVFEGARNNLPDEDAYTAAREVHKLVTTLGEGDILIVLISGGGSALLPMPCPPISLADEMDLTRLLAGQGASIQELNTVRSNIEILKGGGLAQEAKPATVISLILSDVIGDPLDIIASGPTFLSAIHPSQCFHLFKTFDIMDKVPRSVQSFLDHKMTTAQKTPESVDTPDFDNAHWMRVHNIIIGNNSIATSAAASTASDLGYLPLVLSTTLQGDTQKVATMFGKLANYILLIFRRNTKQYNAMLATLEVDLVRSGISKAKLNEVVTTVEKCKNMQKSVCVIAGGETTVKVKGDGLGGRNQEMALSVAPCLMSIQGHSEFRTDTQICFLSAGTDGLDGPTGAAGAVVDIDFAASVAEEGRSLEQFLDNNDSYNLFRLVKNGSNHVITGHTGTNVMDIQILIVKP